MNNVVGQIPDGPSDRQKYMLVVGQFSNPDQPGSSRQLPSQSFSPYFMSPQHYLDALAPASEFQLQHQRSPQQLQQQQHMHMQMQMQHQQHLTPQQLMQIQLQLQQQQHPVRYPYPGPHHPHQVQIGGQPIFPQTRHQLTTQQSPQQQQQSPNQLPPRTIQQQQSPTPPPPQQPKQQQKIKTTHLLAPKKDETNSNGHKPTKNQSTQAKLQNVKKEEYLIHFIDGLNIIESSEPLSDKKAKKKKKLKQQQQQHSQQQPQPQSQPQPLQPQINTQPPPQPRAQPRPQPQPMPHLIPQPHMPPNRHHQQQQQQQQVHPLPAQQLAQPQSLPTATPNQRTNSPASIRAEMPNWSVTDVVRFIEQHEDIKQYAEKFREDEVDGKALLLMIDRNLKLEVLTSMFRYGPAMKVEATLSKYKLND